ncbi:MAG TPA: UDP binding domain-containing protein, partial [Ignavibacteria bacterium]|nr:UDP binding domain-containing protein [Ignavibacteria bacterium]
ADEVTTNIPVILLTIVDKSNHDQKRIIVDKITRHFGEDLEGKTIAVWGLAFKPNTDDMREAPSVIIINELLKHGAKVKVYDPAAMENSKYYLNENVIYAEDEYAASKDADALVILTEWNEFRNPDFDRLKSGMKNNLIFDGRNVFSPEKMRELGISYYSIGRNAVIAN